MPDGLPRERADRLKIEEERLKALPGFMFSVTRFDHAGEAEGVIRDSEAQHHVRIIFESTYPFHRPLLITDSEAVKALPHVNRAGHVCVLRYQPDDWDPDWMTAADLVARAWKLIVNRGELEPEEDDLLPQPLDFDIELHGDGLLAPEGAQGAAGDYGLAQLLPSTMPNLLLLRELKGADGAVAWRANPNDVRRFVSDPEQSPPLVVPWFRTTEAPPYGLESIENLERLVPAATSLGRLLSEAGAVASVPRKAEGPVQVLVNYEDDTGSRWALVEARMYRTRAGRLRPAGAARYLRTFVVGMDAYFGRIDGLVDREALQGAHVVLIGAGAVGSRIATLLNQSGLGRLTVFDGDVVAPGNPVRGDLPLFHLGVPKASSVALSLRQHLPTTEVRPVPVSTALPQGRAELERVLREECVGLCVIAIGDHNGSRYIDRILSGFPVPRIYTWTTRGAAAGAVLTFDRSSGGAGLIDYEAFHHSQRAGLVPDLPEDSEADVPNFIERGCAAPALPATPLDIATVAVHATQTALDLLQVKTVAPFQYWTRRERAWRAVDLRWPPTPQAVKDDHFGAGDSVYLSESAARSMLRHSANSPRLETGGVLLGKRVGGVLRVELAAGPGDYSHQTANGLVLDERYAQGFIDAAAELTKESLRYVGEWHTHPNGGLTPSPTDLMSLRTLATNADANIDAPVILIVGTTGGRMVVRAFAVRGETVVELKVSADSEAVAAKLDAASIMSDRD